MVKGLTEAEAKDAKAFIKRIGILMFELEIGPKIAEQVFKDLAEGLADYVEADHFFKHFTGTVN